MILIVGITIPTFNTDEHAGTIKSLCESKTCYDIPNNFSSCICIS